jgi:hypothetical protein
MALFAIRSCEVKPWRVAILFVCVCTLLIFGLFLSRKLGEPRYLRLHAGMTLQQVHEIMGDPDAMVRSDDGEDWSYRHRESIELHFRGGRLVDANAGKGFDLATNP